MSELTSSDTVILSEDLRTTRELTPLEIDELVEPERRYKPEKGDKPETTGPDVRDLPRTASAPLTTRSRAARACTRTVRMRVLNFKPLTRPVDEVSTTPRRSLAKLLAALFVPNASPSCV